MNRTISAGAAALSILLLSGGAAANDMAYSGFPVTVKGYQGKKTTSVSYTGQIARHVLHDSLKKLVQSGNGKANPELKAKMTAYFSGKDAGRKILAPASKGKFAVKQGAVDAISKGKNLAGKTYKAAVAGMPNGMTGPELVAFWIDKASSANRGFDAANGYDYGQLVSKFIMGAVFYNQAVDGYLDEYLSATKKPNDRPYKKGAAYTGKEHAWDEAFGYFGTPAHTLMLTPKQVYGIAKRKGEAFAAADMNKDGKIDLKTEMTFGPAYYAAGFDASVYDKGNKTAYLHTIAKAFLDGRKLLTGARGERLTDAQRASADGPREDDLGELGEGPRRGGLQIRRFGLQGHGEAQDHRRRQGRPGQGVPRLRQALGRAQGLLAGLAGGQEQSRRDRDAAQPDDRRRPAAAEREPGRRHRLEGQLRPRPGPRLGRVHAAHGEGADAAGREIRCPGPQQRRDR